MSQAPDDLVEITPWPSGKPAVAAEDTALKLVRVKADAASKRLVAKRAHDVTSALRTLRFALESLQSGYRFDDEGAAAKLASMERALGALDRESQLLHQVFDLSTSG